MTRRGWQELPDEARKLMAALYHIHRLTHPERIGRRFHVTTAYIRELWWQFDPASDPSLLESLREWLKPQLRNTCESPAQHARARDVIPSGTDRETL